MKFTPAQYGLLGLKFNGNWWETWNEKKKGLCSSSFPLESCHFYYTGKFPFQNLKPRNINPTSQFDDSCLGCMLKN